MIADDSEDIAMAAMEAIRRIRREASQHGDTVIEARQIAAVGVSALEKILGIGLDQSRLRPIPGEGISSTP